VIISRRQAHWKHGWGKPLLRTALLYAGGTALAACAVLLGIAVFTEPGTGAASGTYLAVGMIAGCLAVGVVLTIMVTHPGWPTGLCGGILALAFAIGGWIIYSTMPTPGHAAYIAHRNALGAMAFAFGVIGGGLVVLGEMTTDGKVPAPRWRPPADLTVRVCVLSVAVVILAAAAGTPAAHEWTDDANTDATRSHAPPPSATKLSLKDTARVGDADGSLGTPYGLLIMDERGDDASVAVTMRDAATGAERWHHRRWNRQASGAPVLSHDKKLVALPAQRRDDTTLHFTTVLDTENGAQRHDVPIDGDPGQLRAVDGDRLLFASTETDRFLTSRDLSGHVRWRYSTPHDCGVSALADDGKRVLAGLSCRPDTGTRDHTRLVALDEATGKPQWTWHSKADGVIYTHGIAITPTDAIVDVRSDKSSNDGLFAARKFRHDLSAIDLDSGEQHWRRDHLDLGNTYAPACAGTLQLAGTDPEAGRVALGECHQITGSGGASFDVKAYALSDGHTVYKVKTPLGYAPTRDEDASGWFTGLPDGRVVVAADESLDLTRPQCRLYAAGPDTGHPHPLPVPGAERDTAWCQQVSVNATPDGVAASFPVKGRSVGRYFAIH
jgi:outer membrane protein assembly factor BamB